MGWFLLSLPRATGDSLATTLEMVDSEPTVGHVLGGEDDASRGGSPVGRDTLVAGVGAKLCTGA